MVKIGVVFPQSILANDAAVIKDYAQAAEDSGYSHIISNDHVLGVKPKKKSTWQGGYTYRHAFQEVFCLFSFLAGITSRIEFATGILVLPQRQTALVAKQAASVDILSGGRLRLGVAVGWNQFEYVALNKNFNNRGKRIEEQIQVLRELWGRNPIEYQGNWHNIPNAGINPLPQNHSIPIWLGGTHENVLRRVAALADGWMLGIKPPENIEVMVQKIHKYARENGRDMKEIGLEAGIRYHNQTEDDWFDQIRKWQALGTTHIALNTGGRRFDTPKKHIASIRHFAQVMRPAWDM
jgi:probable F420-dependent oxidoreductase